VLAASC